MEFCFGLLQTIEMMARRKGGCSGELHVWRRKSTTVW